MGKRLSIACGGLMLVMAGTARADWQYTRWGMTADEAYNAANGAAERVVTVDKNKDGTLSLITARYEGNGIPFSAVFKFDDPNKRLVEVDLLPRNMDACYDIGKSLTATYGPAQNASAMTAGRTKQWWDREHNNLIAFAEIGSLCFLNYTPITAAGAKGGL